MKSITAPLAAIPPTSARADEPAPPRQEAERREGTMTQPFYVAFAASVLLAASAGTLHAEELYTPVPGAVVRYYNCHGELGPHNDLGGNTSIHEKYFLQQLPRCLSGQIAPVVTTVDNDSTFSTKMSERQTVASLLSDTSYDRRIGIWDGFIKNSSGGTYTFTMGFGERNNWASCFAVWINGHQLTIGNRQAFSGSGGAFAFNVVLRPGFNHIRIALEASKRDPLTITYKKADSIKPPKYLGPGSLWHEDEPDDEDDADEE